MVTGREKEKKKKKLFGWGGPEFKNNANVASIKHLSLIPRKKTQFRLINFYLQSVSISNSSLAPTTGIITLTSDFLFYFFVHSLD